MDLKEILMASIVLFGVINIIGSIPIIVALREKVGYILYEKTVLVAVLIMLPFLFF
tara:strand:- start:6266 stop:6433 length:168 start_codon:yes stop_codon:yes gene_type:complete